MNVPNGFSRPIFSLLGYLLWIAFTLGGLYVFSKGDYVPRVEFESHKKEAKESFDKDIKYIREQVDLMRQDIKEIKERE